MQEIDPTAGNSLHLEGSPGLMLPHHTPQRPWVWGCRVFHLRAHNSYELKKTLYFSSLFLTTKPTVIIQTVQIIPNISVNKTEGSHLFQLFILNTRSNCYRLPNLRQDLPSLQPPSNSLTQKTKPHL